MRVDTGVTDSTYSGQWSQERGNEEPSSQNNNTAQRTAALTEDHNASPPTPNMEMNGQSFYIRILECFTHVLVVPDLLLTLCLPHERSNLEVTLSLGSENLAGLIELSRTAVSGASDMGEDLVGERTLRLGYNPCKKIGYSSVAVRSPLREFKGRLSMSQCSALICSAGEHRGTTRNNPS